MTVKAPSTADKQKHCFANFPYFMEILFFVLQAVNRYSFPTMDEVKKSMTKVLKGAREHFNKKTGVKKGEKGASNDEVAALSDKDMIHHSIG